MRSSCALLRALVVSAGLALPIAAASAQFTIAGEPISCTPLSVNACDANLGPCMGPACTFHASTLQSMTTSTFIFEAGRKHETEIEWGPWCVFRDTKSGVVAWGGFAHAFYSRQCDGDTYDCGPCEHFELGIHSENDGPIDVVCKPFELAITSCQPSVTCGEPPFEHEEPEYPMLCELDARASLDWPDPRGGQSNNKARFAMFQNSGTESPGSCVITESGYGFATAYHVLRETLQICKGTSCTFDDVCGDPVCGSEEQMYINHKSTLRAGVCWGGNGPVLAPSPAGSTLRIITRVKPQGAPGWGVIQSAYGAMEYQPNGPGIRTGFYAGTPGSGLEDLIDGATNGPNSVTIEGEVTFSMTDVSNYINGLTGVTSLEMETYQASEDYVRDGRLNSDARVDWDDRRLWNSMLGLTVADEDFRFALDLDLDGDIDITDLNAYTIFYDANAPCPGDCGSSGGSSTLDGAISNDDYVVFINEYFNNDPSADIGQTGGVPGSDGVLSNNDWVVFFNWYFGTCS